MELEEILSLRKTCRAYTDESISEDELETILRAAQRAPLAAGDNKTTFLTVVRQGALLEEIRETCTLINKTTGVKKDALYGAQTLILFSAADVSDDHIEYANAGCVIENMHLAATALGLGSTYIWGCLRKLRKNTELMEKLELPEGYELLSAFAVGHPAEPLAPREYAQNFGMRIL